MKWRRVGSKGQIEDRRGQRSRGGGFRMPRGRASGGGGLQMPRGKGGGALGGGALIAIIIGILAATGVFGGGSGGGSGFNVPGLETLPPAPQATGDQITPDSPQTGDDAGEFVRFVVQDVQEEWTRLFQEAGATYQVTKLVLFSEATESGCGAASSATGPFYCPLDQGVYMDLTFFNELNQRFGAPGTGGPGEFAVAYVIAHEFGHHVQNVRGINEAVRREQQADPGQANELSVRLELQADCLAGVWGHTAFEDNLLEPGDIEQGLAAAAAVGDDRIQQATQGRINPESVTHGSSEQRQRWFSRGYESGDPAVCDETFTSNNL